MQHHLTIRCMSRSPAPPPPKIRLDGTESLVRGGRPVGRSCPHPLSGQRWRPLGAPTSSVSTGGTGAQRPNLSNVVPIVKPNCVATQESRKCRYTRADRHRTRTCRRTKSWAVRLPAIAAATVSVHACRDPPLHRAAARPSCVRDRQRGRQTGDAGSLPRAGHHFSQYFVDYYHTLVAAVWSCGGADVLRYPARYLFVFDHHRHAAGVGSPTWRVPSMGGQLRAGDRSSADEWTRTVHRCAGCRTGIAARVMGRRGVSMRRRRVHPDQRCCFDEPTPAERAVLGATYPTNSPAAHRRVGPCPPPSRPRILELPGDTRAAPGRGQLRHQQANAPDGGRRYLVTLGATIGLIPAGDRRDDLQPSAVHTGIIAAQRLLPRWVTPVVFAGAYHGWGFHEDGAALGLRAARRLGADWPAAIPQEARWSRADSNPDAGDLPHHDQPLQTSPGAPLSFAYRSYSWYVDVDNLPEAP